MAPSLFFWHMVLWLGSAASPKHCFSRCPTTTLHHIPANTAPNQAEIADLNDSTGPNEHIKHRYHNQSATNQVVLRKQLLKQMLEDRGQSRCYPIVAKDYCVMAGMQTMSFQKVRAGRARGVGICHFCMVSFLSKDHSLRLAY